MVKRMLDQTAFLLLGLALGLTMGLEMKAIVIAGVGALISYMSPKMRLVALVAAAVAFVTTLHFHTHVNAVWMIVVGIIWLGAFIHVIDEYYKALESRKAPGVSALTQ